MITSSIAAISVLPEEDNDYEYNESHWSHPDLTNSTYIKSKTLAERAAWDLQESWKKQNEYCPEIVTICPSFIMGESICTGAQTSTTLVRQMVMNQLYAYPPVRFNMVDIKDCSLAHVRALERADAANKRFILSQERDVPMIDLGNMLFEGLAQKGYNYPMVRRQSGYCTMKFASYFSSEAAFILPMCNKPARTFHNERSREVLGIEYKRDVAELLIETAESLMKNGTIPTQRR